MEISSCFLLHALLIIILAFRGCPASSTRSSNLVQISNNIFWDLDWRIVRPFVSNLDTLMERLRGPEGNSFAQSAVFFNTKSVYHEPFCSAIKKLTVDKISQILFEDNANVNHVILELGLQYCPMSWNQVPLQNIPNLLIPRFPIEYLNAEAFKVIPLDVIVDIVLARANKNLYKKFDLLYEKLPATFWKHEKVNFNPLMRIKCSAFHIHLHPEMMTKLPYGNMTAPMQNLKMIFKMPYAIILEFALNIDNFQILGGTSNLSPKAYSMLLRNCALFNFNAQTYLHSLLSGDPSHPSLFSFIVAKTMTLKFLIRTRLQSFPSERIYLEKLLETLRECYSYLVFSAFNPASNSQYLPIIREYFGEGVFIDYVDVVGTVSAITGVTFTDINTIHPEILMQTLFMAGSEDSIDDPAVPEMVNYFTDNFTNRTRGAASLLTQSHQMAQSFGHLIKRNRNLTHRLYVRFLNSNLPYSTVFTVRRMVRDDYEYVASIVSKGVEMDHSKYAVVLADAFKEKLEGGERPRASISLPAHFQSALGPSLTGMENIRTVAQFGLKMNISKKRKSNFVSLKDLKAEGRSYSLVSSDDEGPLNEAEHHVYLPDISTSFDPALASNEYIHVDYFLKKSSKRRQQRENQLLSEETTLNDEQNQESATEEVHPEIRYLNEMLKAIDKSLRNPVTKFIFHIEGSEVGGFGLLKDSLTNFGKLLSLPRFKTVEASQTGGYFPLPLLCPKVMGYIGAWMSLCIKHNVPLPWNFTSAYRKFLFNAPEQVSIDQLIELLYGDLFQTIRMRFDSDDDTFVTALPNISKMHRLFDLPSTSEPPTPFLLESRFLEQSQENDLFLMKFKEKRFVVDVEGYLQFLQISIRTNLLEGRNEFQKCFKKFFKKEFVPFLTYFALEPYVGESKIDVDEIWNSIRFTGSGVEHLVVDDFDIEIDDDCMSSELDTATLKSPQKQLSPNELFKKIIYKLTSEQLEKFLVFTTGAPRLSKSILQPRGISYFAVKAELPTVNYCLAHTCFNQFMLVIHGGSARATYEKFLESITMGSGFALREF